MKSFYLVWKNSAVTELYETLTSEQRVQFDLN